MAEAMVALTLADHWLRWQGQRTSIAVPRSEGTP
jgi:chorismate synthase